MVRQCNNTLTSGLIQAVRKKTADLHVASLVLCTEKIFLLGGCGFFVSDVISGGLLGYLGPLCLALGTNH